MKALSEKSLVVWNFLKDCDAEGRNVTSADIAKELGMEKKSVDGVITSGLIRNKNLAQRVEAEIEITDEDGNVKHTPVKLIQLTPAGREYDHDAALVVDAEEKAAKAAKAE